MADLKKTEEQIYEMLKNNEIYRNEKGIYTIFPQKELIDKSGKSESTVQRALRGIEEQGYIHRERIAEENIMLFYLLKEDFAGRHIHDRYENATSSTIGLEKNDTSSTERLENCPVSKKIQGHFIVRKALGKPLPLRKM